MNRSDEANAWFEAVYSAVQEIPHGRVTSYGHIASLIGRRKKSWTLLSLWTHHLMQPADFIPSYSWVSAPGWHFSKASSIAKGRTWRRIPRWECTLATSYQQQGRYLSSVSISYPSLGYPAHQGCITLTHDNETVRGQPSGASRQADALRREGVHVERTSSGWQIDLAEYGWFPEDLPSEQDAAWMSACLQLTGSTHEQYESQTRICRKTTSQWESAPQSLK